MPTTAERSAAASTLKGFMAILKHLLDIRNDQKLADVLGVEVMASELVKTSTARKVTRS